MQRINIDKMTLENIKEVDIKAVKKLVIATKMKYLFYFLLSLCFAISPLFELSNKIASTSITRIIIEVFVTLIWIVIALIIGAYNLKRFTKLSIKSIYNLTACKKAQYGMLDKKHFNIHQRYGYDGGGISYYLKVSFPKYNTYTDCIRCSKKLYNKVSKRDIILLISFDEENLGVVISNSNTL